MLLPICCRVLLSQHTMVRLTRSSTAAAAAASSTSGTASKPTLDSVLRASKAGVTKRPSKQKLSKKLTNVAVNGAKTVQQTPVVRPASPTATNAPLVFPSSASKVLSKIAPLSTATDDILNEGISHLLRVDPSLAPLIRQHYCHPFSKAGLAETTDPFQSLVSGIISQQVSGAAAKSIKAKFIALYYPKNGGDDDDDNGGSSSIDDSDGRFPTPEMVLETDQQTLRSAGLSLRKTEYVKSLAEKFHSGDLSAEVFVGSSDQEIVERLIQVRGIGVWSAQMFLLFSLKRLDIFSSSDLGIQRGMAAFAGRDIAKLKKSSSSSTAAANKKNKKWKYMAEEEMIEISEKFRPYRSLFMWYMWKVGSVGIEAFSEDAKTTNAKPSSEA